MKKTLTLLLAVVATAGLSRSADAGSLTARAVDIRPGDSCMPFSGSADVTARHDETGRACSIRVPALVYEHPKVPRRPVFLLTIARGVHARGACLTPGLALEVSIERQSRVGVGTLALVGSGFSLRATPSALDRQTCLLATFDSPAPAAKAWVEALDEQHVLVVTE